MNLQNVHTWARSTRSRRERVHVGLSGHPQYFRLIRYVNLRQPERGWPWIIREQFYSFDRSRMQN